MPLNVNLLWNISKIKLGEGINSSKYSSWFLMHNELYFLGGNSSMDS